LEDSELIASQPGGGLMRKAADYARGGGGGAGGRRPRKWRWPPFEEPEPEPEPDIDDIPVPEGDELPVPGDPIPEPTTILMFTVVGLIVAINKKKAVKGK